MEVKLFRPISCPSCKATNRWSVAFGHSRTILDCECTYRLSLPFDEEVLRRRFAGMPLEYDETKEVVN